MCDDLLAQQPIPGYLEKHVVRLVSAISLDPEYPERLRCLAQSALLLSEKADEYGINQPEQHSRIERLEAEEEELREIRGEIQHYLADYKNPTELELDAGDLVQSVELLVKSDRERNKLISSVEEFLEQLSHEIAYVCDTDWCDEDPPSGEYLASRIKEAVANSKLHLCARDGLCLPERLLPKRKNKNNGSEPTETQQ